MLWTGVFRRLELRQDKAKQKRKITKRGVNTNIRSIEFKEKQLGREGFPYVWLLFTHNQQSYRDL